MQRDQLHSPHQTHKFHRMRHSDRLEALAFKVRIELLRRKWAEPRLAAEIGISSRTLNDRLNARSDWKLQELLALADVLWQGDFLQVVTGFDPDTAGSVDPAHAAALLALARQIAAPAGPIFTQDVWMFDISGCRASRATECMSTASRNVGPERAMP